MEHSLEWPDSDDEAGIDDDELLPLAGIFSLVLAFKDWRTRPCVQNGLVTIKIRARLEVTSAVLRLFLDIQGEP
jgi:hypothetical protein